MGTSVELIFPDGTEGFQIDAGVEHYGGHSLGSPKKNMRLSFKSIYGDAGLSYDLFGDDAADQFDQLLLRTRVARHLVLDASRRRPGRTTSAIGGPSIDSWKWGSSRLMVATCRFSSTASIGACTS